MKYFISRTDQSFNFVPLILFLSIQFVISAFPTHHLKAQTVHETGIWMKYELNYQSTKSYENPIYDVSEFYAEFTSPTGKKLKINGFWDGGTNWKIRFAPNELGTWTYTTSCADLDNTGLHQITGQFNCVENESNLPIYQRGSIMHGQGTYHLSFADGTPFFWTACTAWNGALKSTETEWEQYLENRVKNNYNVIQLVTTQWRGCEKDANGELAFEGSGRIQINPEFYQRLDKKIDQVNAHGLVAAPVLLWALQFGRGRHLSPGYYLPEEEAILLARYTVARYGGNQVVWFLGGDGRYVDEFEQRWKNIGRAVFSEDHPGIVAQHPQGRSWIGNDYIEEDWLDIVGYQSSHSAEEGTVNWINQGPMAENWSKIPARPLINLEPIYEEIKENTTAEDVRNASYWSLFATPLAGISYGANGIWPWHREGEKIENHNDAPWTSTWEESISLPAGVQIGYLSTFIQQFDWWEFKPATHELLLKQPGDQTFNYWVSVVKTEDYKRILAYIPVQTTIELLNPRRLPYEVAWFNPVTNTTSKYVKLKNSEQDGSIKITSPAEQDFVLILKSLPD